MAGKLRASLARAALAVASIALVLGGAECAMRILGLGQIMTYRPDPRFGYLMVPSQRISTYGSTIEINRLGLRGPEVSPHKTDDRLRVLFLGDSITYGGGRVPESELFCRRVEQLAARDGIRIEAVNVSAPGWSPQNWAAWLATNGTLEADLAVAVIPTIDRGRPFASWREGEILRTEPWLRLTSLWLKVWSARLRGPPLTTEALAANLSAVKRALGQLGGTPVLAVFVGSRDGGDPNPSWWQPYQALFPEALDLRSGFAASDFLDDVHFRSSGHRIIAERIYARLHPQLAALAARRRPGGGAPAAWSGRPE